MICGSMNKASANVRAAVTRVAFAFLSSRTLHDAVYLNIRHSIPSLAKTRLTHEFGWAKSALRLVPYLRTSCRTFRRSASLCPTH